MLVYQDLLTGDELLSDSFPYKEIESGALWEVEGKWVVKKPVDVDIHANPSAKGTHHRGEPIEDKQHKVVDIVDAFLLQEQPPLDEKQLAAYFDGYTKKVTPKLPEEKREEFKKSVDGATKYLVPKLKDLKVYVGESMHEDACRVFSYYREGAADPTFLYFPHALKEVEC